MSHELGGFFRWLWWRCCCCCRNKIETKHEMARRYVCIFLCGMCNGSSCILYRSILFARLLARYSLWSTQHCDKQHCHSKMCPDSNWPYYRLLHEAFDCNPRNTDDQFEWAKIGSPQLKQIMLLLASYLSHWFYALRWSSSRAITFEPAVKLNVTHINTRANTISGSVNMFIPTLEFGEGPNGAHTALHR